MALRIHTVVFWVTTPYSLLVVYKNFAETHYLPFQSVTVQLMWKQYGPLTCWCVSTSLYGVNPNYNRNYELFHTTYSTAFKWVGVWLIPMVKTAGGIFQLYLIIKVYQ